MMYNAVKEKHEPLDGHSSLTDMIAIACEEVASQRHATRTDGDEQS